ncbi:hypothetical protein QN277_028576 [Acacia crassicarpa]|uniref:Uncharacterized protein n=1 Tax=Acacia crassicarpa TaxID=499986 RepID=A0AAE1MD99_9FABA|nr:hypothetical protein QN277_028576 [Acacia crassicarpa]
MSPPLQPSPIVWKKKLGCSGGDLHGRHIWIPHTGTLISRSRESRSRILTESPSHVSGSQLVESYLSVSTV